MAAELSASSAMNRRGPLHPARAISTAGSSARRIDAGRHEHHLDAGRQRLTAERRAPAAGPPAGSAGTSARRTVITFALPSFATDTVLAGEVLAGQRRDRLADSRVGSSRSGRRWAVACRSTVTRVSADRRSRSTMGAAVEHDGRDHRHHDDDNDTTRIRLRVVVGSGRATVARLRDDIGELLSSHALPGGGEHHRNCDGGERRTGHVRNGYDAEIAHPDDRTGVVHVAGAGFERWEAFEQHVIRRDCEADQRRAEHERPRLRLRAGRRRPAGRSPTDTSPCAGTSTSGTA